MENEAPTGGARRWKRWLLLLALLPFLAFGASNLALNSPWFLRWIAGKIEQRTTLETRIGGASWSPWNGATILDLQVEQPAVLRPIVSEPLIRISSMRIVPVWKQWLHGVPDVREITLKSPRIVLPLELVSHFAPPVEIKTQPAPAPSAAPTPQAVPPPAPATPPEATQPAAPPATAAAPPPPSAPTDFVHLSDASFALVIGGSPILETSGISGSVPVAGKEAKSSLKISSLEMIGQKIVSDLRLPLHWQSPAISLVPTDFEFQGLKLKFAGQLALLSNLPAGFDLVLPKQPGQPIALPGGNSFAATEVTGNTRFRGLLLAPASWQADLVTTAVQPVVKFGGNESKFDNAQTITVLRGGTLSCIDARIIGDQVSMLGNATVRSDGRAAAVLRIVAPPETTMGIVNQFFPGLKAPPAFSAMSTPQRAALDLEAFGSLGDLQFRLGKNGPLVGAPVPPPTATPP